MTRKLLYLPEVEEDILASHAWYEEKSKGVGEEFLRMVRACVSEVLRYPDAAPRVDRRFHRRLLRRFPYAVYYTMDRDNVVVLALFHCARDPRTMMLELKNRSDRRSSY